MVERDCILEQGASRAHKKDWRRHIYDNDQHTEVGIANLKIQLDSNMNCDEPALYSLQV